MVSIVRIGQRYDLGPEIGRGGMQAVHQAFDARLGRQVAVKKPLGTSALKRFSESAQLSARVRHPNVATALDYFVEGSTAYFVEELIDGINLQACFDNHFFRLCPDSTAKVLHHLAKGVAASHDASVIHRDLKPSNVMVSSDLSFTSIKITDFGIAKLAEQQIDSDLKEIEKADKSNVSSTLLGAIPFMAPEALAKDSGARPEKPIDIWSLGAIAYWMLTGQHPFGSQITAVASIMSGKPPQRPSQAHFSGATSDLAEALWKLILDCMAFDPTARPTADLLAQRCGQLVYLDSPRSTATITGKDSKTQIWFAASTGGGLALPAAEFVHGAPKTQARVSCFAFPGRPNQRGISILELR